MSQDISDLYQAPGAGSSAYYSTLFLDSERRRAVTLLLAIYAEMRRVVEKTEDANIARIKLAWWRNQLVALTLGRPEHPACLALLPFVAKFNLASNLLGELVDGLEIDLMQTRYLDFSALERYCVLVGGSLSALVAGICGNREEDLAEYARLLGVGVQMTTIIRDAGEHARVGRIYLPVNELKQFQVPAADLLNARHSDAFASLMQFQCDRALSYFDAAALALPAKARKVQRCGLILMAFHRALLEEIKADGFQVLQHKVGLTPLRKFWLAWKTWVF